jgi:hypothetical protein
MGRGYEYDGKQKWSLGAEIIGQVDAGVNFSYLASFVELYGFVQSLRDYGKEFALGIRVGCHGIRPFCSTIWY